MLEGRKLLLADDSLAIQRVIELTFVDEGMIVVSVGNGQLAVEKLEEERPDIVLADVYMPELNGYQVCERIKRDERFRHVPVVLLVGSFEPFNEAEARRVGADDYLTKPFQSIRQLVSKVGSLLSGRKSAEESDTQELPAQPGEAEARERARADNLELTTADTAPLPQHLRQEAQAANLTSNQSFADLQLDDEMIEETPASAFGAGEQTMAGSSRHRATEPFSAQDLSDMGVKTAATTATGQHLTASAAGIIADEAGGTGSTPAPAAAATSSPAHAASRANAGDDALLDLDDVEMPRAAAMAEADDFILDLQDVAESRAAAAPSADALPPAVESVAHSTESEAESEAKPAEQMTEAAPQAVQSSEAQVLGWERHEESASAEASQLAPTGELPESSQPKASPAQGGSTGSTEAAQASETPASQPGQIELAQLSPEAIDAIARRVVEHLSTQVVEQIAWEVVPQLAELLIKRRLEEEGKK